MINNTLKVNDNFTPKETLIIQSKIYEFLTEQIKLYTVGDSSSVTKDTADDLMKSITYVLNTALEKSKSCKRQLLADDIETIYSLGQKIIHDKTQYGKKLLSIVKETAPDINNESYWYTIRGISSFFKRYNPMFLAHLIPCDIDYPLMNNVDENLLGIDYITAYLKGMLLENTTINLFDTTSAKKVLKISYIDYVELPLNLCEPLLINAIGLVLLKKDPFSLMLSEDDIAKLYKLLYSKTNSELTVFIKEASKEFIYLMHIDASYEALYFQKSILKFIPRLSEAISEGNITKIFCAI